MDILVTVSINGGAWHRPINGYINTLVVTQLAGAL